MFTLEQLIFEEAVTSQEALSSGLGLMYLNTTAEVILFYLTKKVYQKNQ